MNDTAHGHPATYTTPRQARHKFIEAKKGDVKASTVRAYKYPTKDFVETCEALGVESTSEIDGNTLNEWKDERRADVKQITLHNNVKHLRVFIRFLQRRELAEPGLVDKITVPPVDRQQAVSEERLHLEQYEGMYDYLSTYEYASRNHALLHLMWHTGCRISGALALDLGDLDLARNTIKFRHRVDTGTPLKNNSKSERNVNVSDELVTTLRDYIEGRRTDTLDEYDREPLFTLPDRRLYRQRAYKNITSLSRPCYHGKACPHDRDIDECEFNSADSAPGCPSVVSLHPVRRGSITYHLNAGWPKEKLSERVDVSVAVLEKHYDARTKEEKREKRQEFISNL